MLVAPLALVATIVALAPSTASATGLGYALSYTSLPNGTKPVVRWNPCQSAITYKVNLADVPTAMRPTILSETQATVGRLAAYTGMAFSYRGSTTEVPHVGSMPTQSAELVIAYTTPAKTNYYLWGSTVGEGGLYYSWSSVTVSGRTTYSEAAQRGFVVIDTPQMLAQLSGGFGAGTRRANLLMHELGHAVGLQHVTDASQAMYPSLMSSAPNLGNWGDRAGLSRVGRSAGCIDTSHLRLADLR
ncbi:MAG TPA: matrixin family metalloprotease [Pedococcus sp.]|nr:matrixin family metalloprotease [Pedococcus sp.]